MYTEKNTSGELEHTRIDEDSNGRTCMTYAARVDVQAWIEFQQYSDDA